MDSWVICAFSTTWIVQHQMNDEMGRTCKEAVTAKLHPTHYNLFFLYMLKQSINKITNHC
jgi:hypothetical protein